jgi:predicted ATP-dependent endonuclease of OLD family
MKYIAFTIDKYKGIEEPLTLNIEKNSLIPIIGVNECGKTTILQAIFAFDYTNDSFNDTVRHLEDIKNRYKSSPADPKISAEISITKDEMNGILNDLAGKEEMWKSETNSYKRKIGINYNGLIKITRNLVNKKYSIEPDSKNVDFSHKLSTEIIKVLPYTLFFDDFRDSIASKIEIKPNKDGELDGWLAIIDRLFVKTDADYNILELPEKEERDRKGIISNVNRKLENVLTAEWKNFRLEDKQEALKVQLDYEKETVAGTNEIRHYIKFDVVEKDKNGQEYYFYLQDRSKGFYWFFNFVMKLEFNPKVIDSKDENTIYLLDEPGSYLHAHAQTKLSNKLKSLSSKNKIIYCTHSHYLLNPEVIPINSIRVAHKDPNTLYVALKTIYEFEGSIKDKKSAFQPVIDALQVKPMGLELSSKNAVIVEGIYDYYCFEMFKGKSSLSFIPGSNADSIKYLISLMIFSDTNYRVLFDGDDEGKRCYNEAIKYFGEQEGKKFKTLADGKILQNLFKGEDLVLIRNKLEIDNNSSFEKTMVTLFYSDKRANILKLVKETKGRFTEIIKELNKI